MFKNRIDTFLTFFRVTIYRAQKRSFVDTAIYPEIKDLVIDLYQNGKNDLYESCHQGGNFISLNRGLLIKLLIDPPFLQYENIINGILVFSKSISCRSNIRCAYNNTYILACYRLPSAIVNTCLFTPTGPLSVNTE